MKIKISEIFSSIQGEGSFAGKPMFFIRSSNCTRKCGYCDTQYHIKGKFYSTDTIVEKIKKSKSAYVCWTGGEPLLQREAIQEIIKQTKNFFHHLETNGDLLEISDFDLFDYIAISPKEIKIAERIKKLQIPHRSDIKVVTDLDKIGKDLISFATMLMPLTTYNQKKDLEIQKKVWNYCIRHNLDFTPRYQVWIFRKKRGI